MLTVTNTLPWLAVAQARLRAAASRQRLPSALLVHGSTGVGAAWFARWAAALALCERPANAPCGVCRHCLRVNLQQHPDFLWLSPLPESREIRVDQIRGLSAELALTSHEGGHKVAVLEPAERMNRNAANALLKTIEEPMGRCMLILVTAQPARLPATLRSRCHRIDLAPPTPLEAAAWIKNQGGGDDALRLANIMGLEPLSVLGSDATAALACMDETVLALQSARSAQLDVVATAERWARENYEWRLHVIENWLTDCVRHGISVGPAAAKMGADAHLPGRRPALNIRSLFELLDGVRDLRRLAETPLNKSLALERLLWRVTADPGRSNAGAPL